MIEIVLIGFSCFGITLVGILIGFILLQVQTKI